MKIGRQLTVRAVARGLRKGIPAHQLHETLATSHPHRDADWRLDVMADAYRHNEEHHPQRTPGKHTAN